MLKGNGGNRFTKMKSMVESLIKEHSGEYKIYQLWKNLPKKIMYQTYKLIVSYLVDINRVAVDSTGMIGYIWSPEFKQDPKLKWL
jgi:tyrosyl-tRNA synthetase